MIASRLTKAGVEIYPKFIVKKSSDLMIRGSDFYAIWIEDKGLWSTDENDAIQLIDRALDEYVKEYGSKLGDTYFVRHLWDAETGMIDRWHKFCQHQLRDHFHQLDGKLIFSNMECKKEDYASRTLPYPLEECDISSYEKLASTLYAPEERHKFEWAIGSIVNGASVDIQKFLVFYGDSGTGKSTILNIIEDLFQGYKGEFRSKDLGSANSSFSLEPLKNNPLVAIQHDGDLSKIEDNTTLNSLVSHEVMTVNEKHKSIYSNRFRCFLFIGTNRPVKITDSRSGIIRRLIDVYPIGNKIPYREYMSLTKKVKYELGGIAMHCKKVFEKDPDYYNSYIPTAMMSATNDFYNYVEEYFFTFKEQNGTTMKAAWEMYKTHCTEAKVLYPLSQRVFKEELKNYFTDYLDRYTLKDGTRVRSYFSGFKESRFIKESEKSPDEKTEIPLWLQLKSQPSIFDNEMKDAPAQYPRDDDSGRLNRKWVNCKTSLKDIDTSKVHHVKVPMNHIVVDFDMKDKDGNKSYSLNAVEAAKLPETYAELSKSGGGLHLHYIYDGDPTKLDSMMGPDIEIKVYSGDSSLRRRLSECNDLPIRHISSGLPLRKEKNVVVEPSVLKSEKALRRMIEKCLAMEYKHKHHITNINFIEHILEEAYTSDLVYDVSDMRGDIFMFAAQSHNQAQVCLDKVANMKFKSKVEEFVDIPFPEEGKMVMFDVEVFPNLFNISFKEYGEENPVIKVVNPEPIFFEKFFKYKLVGFNNRNYDNHICYAAYLGYDNQKLFEVSQDIINGTGGKFKEAYNLSYTDIYDFAATKQSLKKWEIELDIHHQELGLPWDKPVPLDMWELVGEYCANDVMATEAVFNHLKSDFEARKALAKIAGGTPNETTNTLTGRLIFGNNKHPQDEFIYTDLSEMFPGYKFDPYAAKGKKSLYKDIYVGEGGLARGVPGIYKNVALLDIASMHPHSIIALMLFGPRYTKVFEDLVHARMAIKHRDFDTMRTIFNGAFAEYISASDEELDNLAQALKIAINSVYGLTSAKFDNLFKDPRNIDNIVAKRGALFMVDLKEEVEKRGFQVCHIKTDSIKIPDATPEIIEFVMEFGKKYGYSFEHEATYEKMCLVNDAVYIAKYDSQGIRNKGGKHAGEWTATGTQFQIPYVFKKLFSHEDIQFKDLCVTQSTKSALYLDMNEKLEDEAPYLEKIKKLSNDAVKHIQECEHPAEELAELKATLSPEGLKSKKAEFKKKAQEIFRERFYGRVESENTSPWNDQLLEGYFQEWQRLVKECETLHDYQFVGKVGQFCPIKPNFGGGLLMREDHGKYSAATGTKGFRFLESETVKKLNLESSIDTSYFDRLCDEAITTINEYGDFYIFAN